MFPFDKAAHIAPDVHAGQQDGHLDMLAVIARRCSHGRDEAARGVGIQRQEGPAEVWRMALRMVSSTEGSIRMAGSMFWPREYM